MRKEIIYSHRPYMCPHCGMLDTEKDPNSIIDQKDLPANGTEFGWTVTIKCPFCKNIYKAEFIEREEEILFDVAIREADEGEDWLEDEDEY